MKKARGGGPWGVRVVEVSGLASAQGDEDADGEEGGGGGFGCGE
jgi:hypothetical protein